MSFLDTNTKSKYGHLSLDERRLVRARRKAAASASHRRTEGIKHRRQGFREIFYGKKGWRPSAGLKLETGSGSFHAYVSLPDVGSIALSFLRCPRSRVQDPGIVDAKIPFFATGLRGRQSRAETAPKRPRS